MIDISIEEYHTRLLSEKEVNDINRQITEKNKKILGIVLYGYEKCLGEEVVSLLLIGTKTIAILEKEV